jgi:hypothetical protein
MVNFVGIFNEKARDVNRVKGVRIYSAGPAFPRVVAVTSGKGGVGKTNIVGNLAIALRRLGKRVLILGDLENVCSYWMVILGWQVLILFSALALPTTSDM